MQHKGHSPSFLPLLFSAKSRTEKFFNGGFPPFYRQLIQRYRKNLFVPKTVALQYKKTNDGFGTRVLDSGISSTLHRNFAGFDAHTLDTKALGAHN